MNHHALGLGIAGLLAIGTEAAHANWTFTNIMDPSNPTFTQALGINSAGKIVGYGNATTFNGFQLVLPPVAGNFTRENVPSADGGTQVIGISGNGTTVGFSITGGVTNGFAQTGGLFTTVDKPTTAFNQILGISQNGSMAAGYSSTDPAGATLQMAYTVSGGPTFATPVFTNINGLLPANLNSQATGVNNTGVVVGFYQYDAAGDFSAFEDAGDTVTSFQTPGSVSTQALGINDLGEIVGDFIDADGMMHGFIDNNGTFTTLDPAGSGGTTANGINDAGDVVGFYTSGDNTVGFVANAPEPGTVFVLGTAMTVLGLVRRRQTSKR